MNDLRAELEELATSWERDIEAPDLKTAADELRALLAKLPASPGLPWVSSSDTPKERIDSALVVDEFDEFTIGTSPAGSHRWYCGEGYLIGRPSYYVPADAIPLPGAGEWIEAGEARSSKYVHIHSAGFVEEGWRLSGLLLAPEPDTSYRVLLQRIEEGE